MSTESQFRLKDLVWPMTSERFLRDVWPNKPIVIPSSLERVSALTSPEFESVTSFAQVYNEKVTILHPNGFATDLPSGAAATPFLKQGYTLYFRHIHRFLPKYAAITEGIADELGIPRQQFSCEIFTSFAEESGVAMHSDYDVNFSILLRGKKEWSFVTNEHLVNQTNICVSGGRAQPDPEQLNYAVRLPLPESMPASSERAFVEPGGVVFMPRGTWHLTRSFGDCLSMNFVMKGPHWAKLVCQSLEKRLLEKSAWRDYAYGISASDERKKNAIQELSERLRSLRDSLQDEKETERWAEDLIQRYLAK